MSGERHGAPLGRRSVGAWVAIAAGGILLASLIAIGFSASAVHRLDRARSLVLDEVGPAQTAATQLVTAYINEETGVRGYLLGGEPRFLAPDVTGRRAERLARRRLERLLRHDRLAPDRDEYAATLAAARRWRSEYADPTIATVRARGPESVDRQAVAHGADLFNRLRVTGTTLRMTLATQQQQAEQRLRRAARDLRISLGFAALLLLATAIAAWLVLRRVVTRPLDELRSGARAVAEGDFSRELGTDGPREIADVSLAVEAMRRRVLTELSTIQQQAEELERSNQDLERSNAELEQFAYVASHDLQEPLRKVVSFSQMLERRYKGQLDDRADQYIGFAVDGARRMQVLINDLLAFSRVGRLEHEAAAVPAAAIVADAQANLASAIEESGARVEVGDLPTVRGDRALLTVVFQNLIGNAIKFRGDATPVIRVEAHRDGAAGADDEDLYEFRVADNGIGISPEYGERIFIIFQRLHPRSEYEGTGIGLAMCRKIVEHHGGRIWLDDTTSQGTTFRFTLPTTEDTA